MTEKNNIEKKYDVLQKRIEDIDKEKIRSRSIPRKKVLAKPKIFKNLKQKNINYISGPGDNYRNINTNEPQPMFQRININNNYRKYSGNQINNISITSNKRSISPMNQPNYSRPIISQKQRQVQNNLNNNYSYQKNPHQ